MKNAAVELYSAVISRTMPAEFSAVLGASKLVPFDSVTESVV